MQVKKRNNITEPFKAYKLEAMVTKASEGLSQVSISEVLMIAGQHQTDNMSTYDLQTTIIDAAASLISIDRPNYQYLAARLLNQRIRKEVFGSYEPGTLLDVIKTNVEIGLYMNFLDFYSEEAINNLDKSIVHSRDNNFTYAGLKQLESKYLLKNNGLRETPQIMNMLIMMTIFKDELQRSALIKQGYSYLSQGYISLPTPVMNGARTVYAKYISCNLIHLGDTKESLSEGLKQIMLCTASKSGIGLNASCIRGLGASIGKTGLTHTGLLPILKTAEAATSAFTQVSRGGSSTINYNWFQYEIMDILEFKNVKGSAETRIRNSDHCITFSNLVIERAKSGQNITLFHGVPEVQELNNVIGLPEFDILYEKLEKSVNSKNKKTVKASALINLFLQERLETGRLYAVFAENAAKGPWLQPCTKTNLCCEILVEHNPLDTPEGNVGTCILAAVNLGTTPDDRVRAVSGFCVNFLDALIDSHDFEGNTWIEKSAKDSRTLGIGISNLAGWLAKNKLSYLTKEAKLCTSRIMEQFSYGLHETSIELAKIKGPAKNISRTKYAKGTKGWFQHDEYDHLELGHVLDWSKLRKDQEKYGQRHCTLSAVAPVANSAKPSNSTSGIDFVRGLETKKEDKGIITTLVPFIGSKNYYTAVSDEDFNNSKYFEFLEYIQAHVDQSMSVNEYTKLKDITLKDLQTSFLQAQASLKTIYYNNSLTEKTQDGLSDEDSLSDETDGGCESGGCSI